jgi:hypothetical protein
MPMDGPMELSLTLIPPVNGLHDAPPTTKGISTSWAGAVGSVLLFLPIFFLLSLDTVCSCLSFLLDKLLLPPFHLLQLPHPFCDRGHCESQNSHIQATMLPAIAGKEGMVRCMNCAWT